MSCCTLGVFMDDFHYYWPKYHDTPPTEAQIKSAQADWRAGNTGYEGVRNAQNRAADAIAKSKEVLTHMGGRHYKLQLIKGRPA
jgi:D-tyrosyl-tRNA(Tyr) deacylase